MKRLLLFLLLLSPAALRADWKDLRAGMDARAVLHAVGAPLQMNRARAGGFESWTYDAGACVVFIRNQLSYWEPPQSRVVTPAITTPTMTLPAPRAAVRTPAVPGTRHDAAAQAAPPGTKQT